MTANIHFNELEVWQARHRAGEIYINGMTVLTEKGCYRLTYTELPNTLPPEPRTSPLETVGRGVAEVTPAPVAIPVVMVSCPVCSAVHPENEECWICQKFDRLKHLAKRNRHNYALEKRFGKTP